MIAKEKKSLTDSGTATYPHHQYVINLLQTGDFLALLAYDFLIQKDSAIEQVAVLETHKRTIVRAVSYRIIALLITALWTGLGDAVLIHLILTVVHYWCERVWMKIEWGKIKNDSGQ